MKIFLDTIGCRLNQAEIEIMARQFRSAGHEIVASAAQADLAIVNTCTVTTEAAADSRSAIRRASRLGAGGVVVTGCWATLEPAEAAQLPGVQKIIPNLQKSTLAADLLQIPEAAFDLEPLARQLIPGAHRRTRAFIKVQDGCNNACTFCITTLARGESRSRSIDEVIQDVRSALQGGAKEIVLTGVHLGSWGQDLDGKFRLKDLVSAILERTNPARLRLSSLEPWDLGPAFFRLWSDPRLCPHLHLPLQSGSAGVLKRMRRKTTPTSFAALVDSARSFIQDLAITTDVITGFPGETEAEFAETVEFIGAIGFSGGHVFTYSARPGTPAARMKAQVGYELRKKRNTILREVFSELEGKYFSEFIGKKMPVLWEGSTAASDNAVRLEGLSGNYIRVTASAAESRWNEIDEVLLTSIEGAAMEGQILLPDQHPGAGSWPPPEC